GATFCPSALPLSKRRCYLVLLSAATHFPNAFAFVPYLPANSAAFALSAALHDLAALAIACVCAVVVSLTAAETHFPSAFWCAPLVPGLPLVPYFASNAAGSLACSALHARSALSTV